MAKTGSEQLFLTVNGIDLYISEVLLEYGYPRTFLCYSHLNATYLFYEIEADDVHTTWLAVKITPETCQGIMDKHIPLQQPFKTAKIPSIFGITQTYEPSSVTKSFDVADLLKRLPENPVFSEH